MLKRPIPEPLGELIATRLRILGQPLRLRLLDLVDLNPEATVQELADLLGATQQNVSQHLGILFRAGMLTRRKDGTHVHYSLQDQYVIALLEAAAASIGRQLSELSKMVQPDSR
jgi:ArsR family transcriptional regulator